METMTINKGVNIMINKTAIDEIKKNVDFRIIDVSGSKNIIIWKDGKREYVTDKKLEKLEKIYTSTTDF